MRIIEIKRGDKIYIMGNGCQAPYGIGEIMQIVPAAHIRKIQSICNRYYNKPTLRLNSHDGVKVEIDDNQYIEMPLY